MNFLNNWTIDLQKLPKYMPFKATMNLEIDKRVLLAFSNSKKYYSCEQQEILDKIISAIDNDGILKVKHSQPKGVGRFRSDLSPVVLQRHIKHTLFHSQGWIDLDMIKGHPTILYELALRNKFEINNIKKYVSNPDYILEKLVKHYSQEQSLINNDDVKDIFNLLVYGGGYSTWLEQMAKANKPITSTEEHSFISAFKEDCERLRDIIYLSNPALVSHIKTPEKSLYQTKCSTMSYFCGAIENEIIFQCYKLLKARGIIGADKVAPEYDGLCFKKPNMTDEQLNDLVDDINTHILIKTGLNVRMKWKPYKAEHIHDDIIDEAEEIVLEKVEDKIWTFEKVASAFEVQHAKIINNNLFIKEVDDEIITMSRAHITTAYEHLTYEDITETGSKTKNFMSAWLTNNPEQRCYEALGCYPPGIKCPELHFNTWIPFPPEKITEYIHKEEELQLFLNHIKILCGNEEIVADYFEKWIAQMIQYPAVKSICPVIISKQGAGKGTLMKALTKMLGEKKVMETSEPSRDVWGDFNGRMANTFLINLNELKKKETIESEGRIKKLITDSKITINNKGINQYDINSFHRFLSTTNTEDPIGTSEDDRRNLIMRSSDEKCGDKEYFVKLHNLLDDVNVIKTIYEYFKSIPDMDKFGLIPIPKTEYQTNLKQLSRSPLDQWLEFFTLENSDKEEVSMPSGDLYQHFSKWCAKYNNDFKCNNIQFGVRMKNLKCGGITKGVHTKRGETKILDIEHLKKYFGISCIIDTDDVESGYGDTPEKDL
jgi:hypothetical protein